MLSQAMTPVSPRGAAGQQEKPPYGDGGTVPLGHLIGDSELRYVRPIPTRLDDDESLAGGALSKG